MLAEKGICIDKILNDRFGTWIYTGQLPLFATCHGNPYQVYSQYSAVTYIAFDGEVDHCDGDDRFNTGFAAQSGTLWRMIASSDDEQVRSGRF